MTEQCSNCGQFMARLMNSQELGIYECSRCTMIQPRIHGVTTSERVR